MIQNQFHESILFLDQHIAGFIRNNYRVFTELESEFYAHLQHLYSNGYKDTLLSFFKELAIEPYHFINKLDKIKGYDSEKMLLIRAHIEQNGFNNHRIYRKDSKKDPINELNQYGDIEAPVTSISGTFTPFSSNYFNHSITYKGKIKTVIPILFEPKLSSRTVSKFGFLNEIKDRIPDGLFFDTLSFKAFQNPTFFDSMETECKIDINYLFTYFDKKIMFKIIDDGPRKLLTLDDYMDRYAKYQEILKDKLFIDEMLDAIIDNVKKSAFLTYLIYAGKLIANKRDLYDWLYTSFVRDAADRLEYGAYPTSVDLNAIEKPENHFKDTTSGNLIPLERVDPGVGQSDGINKIVGLDYDYRRILFKNLRMKYSNWAAVINAILKIDNDTQKPHIISESIYSSRYKESKDTTVYSLARRVLEQYISISYRTVNIDLTDVKGFKATRNVRHYIEMTIKRIMDPNVSQILESAEISKFNPESAIKSYLITDNVFDTESNVEYLKVQEYAKSIFKELFLQIAYYILLDHLRVLENSIYHEDDPIAGTSKLNLYRETMLSVANNIKTMFEKYVDSFKKADLSNRFDFSKVMNFEFFRFYNLSKNALDEIKQKGMRKEFVSIARIAPENKLFFVLPGIKIDTFDKENNAMSIINNLYTLSPIIELSQIYSTYSLFVSQVYGRNNSFFDKLFIQTRKDKDLLDLHFKFPTDAVSSYVTENYHIFDDAESHPRFRSIEDAGDIIVHLEESISIEDDKNEAAYSQHRSFAQVGDAISEITKTKTFNPDGTVDEKIEKKVYDPEEVNKLASKSKDDDVGVKLIHYAVEDAYNELFCEYILGRSYESFLPDLFVSAEELIQSESAESDNILNSELEMINNENESNESSHYTSFLDGI